jgi:hypothetical protein
MGGPGVLVSRVLVSWCPGVWEVLVSRCPGVREVPGGREVQEYGMSRSQTADPPRGTVVADNDYDICCLSNKSTSWEGQIDGDCKPNTEVTVHGFKFTEL